MKRAFIIAGLVAALAIVALYILWQRSATKVDQLTGDVREARADANTLEKRNDQLERAALERLADDRAVDQLGKDMHDAIKNIPADTAPSPAAVALGCQRLRAAGATASDSFQRVCG